jgi:hypothetical protein
MRSSLKVFSLFHVFVMVGLLTATAHGESPYLFDLLKQKSYLAAWNNMLAGEKNLDKWITRYSKDFDGPATPSVRITIDGQVYLFTTVCEKHNCGNKVYILFAPEGKQAWGLWDMNGEKLRWLGNPSEPLRQAITGAKDD